MSSVARVAMQIPAIAKKPSKKYFEKDNLHKKPNETEEDSNPKSVARCSIIA
jgi:hypothetical protein